jgi:hypothetical protein
VPSERIEPLDDCRSETVRERAVREVDARHGYTMEFSSSPEAHEMEYDEREWELMGDA